MILHIHYPQIMKMSMSSTIDSPDTVTLDELKQKIFKEFWTNFGKWYPMIPKHGTPRDVTVWFEDIVIETDSNLQERLRESDTFRALFTLHGQSLKASSCRTEESKTQEDS